MQTGRSFFGTKTELLLRSQQPESERRGEVALLCLTASDSTLVFETPARDVLLFDSLCKNPAKRKDTNPTRLNTRTKSEFVAKPNDNAGYEWVVSLLTGQLRKQLTKQVNSNADADF